MGLVLSRAAFPGSIARTGGTVTVTFTAGSTRGATRLRVHFVIGDSPYVFAEPTGNDPKLFEGDIFEVIRQPLPYRQDVQLLRSEAKRVPAIVIILKIFELDANGERKRNARGQLLRIRRKRVFVNVS